MRSSLCNGRMTCFNGATFNEDVEESDVFYKCLSLRQLQWGHVDEDVEESELNRARRAPLPYSALILAASPFLLGRAGRPVPVRAVLGRRPAVPRVARGEAGRGACGGRVRRA